MPAGRSRRRSRPSPFKLDPAQDVTLSLSAELARREPLVARRPADVPAADDRQGRRPRGRRQRDRRSGSASGRSRARTSCSTASPGTAGPTRTSTPRPRNGSTSTASRTRRSCGSGAPPGWACRPDEAHDFFDRNGVVVRRSGILDGEAIGYMAIENDAELKRKYGSEIKMELMDNWRDQLIAQVKGERNHPSIMIWSIENEWLYINCINLYGGLMDQFEAEVVEVSERRPRRRPHAADDDRRRRGDEVQPHARARRPLHGRAVPRVSRPWPTRPTPREAGGAAGSGTRSARGSSARSSSPRGTTPPTATSAARRSSSASNRPAAPWGSPCGS